MNTKNVKLPIGKIFIYALIDSFINVLMLVMGFAIIMLVIMLTTGGKDVFSNIDISYVDIRHISKESRIILSYVLAMPFMMSLISFPIMLYDYYMVRNILIRLDYTLVKIKNQKVQFKTSQVNYTLKISRGRFSLYLELNSEDGRIYDKMNSLDDFEKLLYQLDH